MVAVLFLQDGPTLTDGEDCFLGPWKGPVVPFTSTVGMKTPLNTHFVLRLLGTLSSESEAGYFVTLQRQLSTQNAAMLIERRGYIFYSPNIGPFLPFHHGWVTNQKVSAFLHVSHVLSFILYCLSIAFFLLQCLSGAWALSHFQVLRQDDSFPSEDLIWVGELARQPGVGFRSSFTSLLPRTVFHVHL